MPSQSVIVPASQERPSPDPTPRVPGTCVTCRQVFPSLVVLIAEPFVQMTSTTQDKWSQCDNVIFAWSSFSVARSIHLIAVIRRQEPDVHWTIRRSCHLSVGSVSHIAD